MRGNQLCYMCDAPAVSKEHVPPKCIFPERKDIAGQNFREGLITVPSCDAHNSKKSSDDEFLMVSLAGIIGNNSIGYQHKMTKVNRAISKASNRLLDKAFINRKHFIVRLANNKFIEVIRGTADYRRLEKCFEQIAFGLFFHQFKKRFAGQLKVQMNYLDFEKKDDATLAQFLKRRVELELNDKERFGKNPAVFFYQFTNPDQFGLFAVRLCFYEGVEVLVAFKPDGTETPFVLGLELMKRGIKTVIELDGKEYKFNE